MGNNIRFYSYCCLIVLELPRSYMVTRVIIKTVNTKYEMNLNFSQKKQVENYLPTALHIWKHVKVIQ